MENTNWLKQTSDKPAFLDVLWNRPENKRYAGKLLIIGGYSQSFSEPSRAYTAAVKAGAGTVRIVLPDSLQKTVGRAFLEAEFAASTPIGSFSRPALDLFLDLANWADGVLLAGDFGKNSETAVLLDSFVSKYEGQLNLAGDSLDYFLQKPSLLTKRENTLLVGSLVQMQKMAQPDHLIRQNADLMQILSSLNAWITTSQANVITEQANQLIVASEDKVSTTLCAKGGVEPELAAYASVWWLQQPEKSFETLSTAVYCYASS